MHRTIKGFDGIRALAVISVVLTHLGVLGALADRKLLPPSLIPMIDGNMGVRAFFVLSGFLITTLLVHEFNASGTISIRIFIVRRTLRIFPLYVLFLIIATLLHIFGRNITSWNSLIYAYTYAYNFVPTAYYTSFIGHTWSLAVEEHFYLVWPTVFLLLFGKHRLVLLGLVVTFVASAPFVLLALIKEGLSAHYFVDRWSFIAGSSIAMGCLAAILIGSEQTRPTFRRITKHPATLLVGTLLCANSLYLFLLTNSWFLQTYGTDFLRSIGIALVVAWLYFNQASLLANLLELRPLKYIGAISYGIYMYQGLFLSTGPYRDPDASWPPSIKTGLVLLVLAAPLSYHYFEMPFLRLKRRYSAPREPSRVKAVQAVA